jgi:hypothetical protein
MSSIGYTSSMGGSTTLPPMYVTDPSNAGGAIKGFMPKSLGPVDKTYPEFENIRNSLKQAWNTTYMKNMPKALARPMTSPFRAVNNAGDLLSRQNYSCGGTCQTPQSRPGMSGLRYRFGQMSYTCMPSIVNNPLQLDASVQAAACNGKYVYDSSDYITYRKHRAILANYNDLSYGGNQNNAAQSAMRAIRRY